MSPYRLLGAVTLIALLAYAPVIADSGYRTDYDFPGQGDDWYGSPTALDPNRDFPPIFMLIYSDGDDFGLGYEIETDLLGLGPSLDLTNTSLFEYLFRFGLYGVQIGPIACHLNNDCSDSILCNGLELCTDGQCQPGPPPSCSDSDSCTIDSCDQVADACIHRPTGPGEVGGVSMELQDLMTTIALLDWDPQVPADYFNLYRGQAGSLGDLACFAAGVIGTSTNDDGALPPNGLFIYLLTAYACQKEATLGTGSDGIERSNQLPCLPQ